MYLARPSCPGVDRSKSDSGSAEDAQRQRRRRGDALGWGPLQIASQVEIWLWLNSMVYGRYNELVRFIKALEVRIHQ